MSDHKHGYGCPETAHHADTPIYDQTAWEHGLAPLPTVDELRATYLAQVAAGHAAGGGAL